MWGGREGLTRGHRREAVLQYASYIPVPRPECAFTGGRRRNAVKLTFEQLLF